MADNCLNCGTDSVYRCTKCKKGNSCSKKCWDEMKLDHESICSQLIGHSTSDNFEKGRIVATGEYTVKSNPDTVTFDISISHMNENLKEAREVVKFTFERITSQVFSNYKEIDVEKTTFTITPVTKYIENKDPVRLGFRATKSVIFSTQNLLITENIVKIISEIGGNFLIINGINFSLKKYKEAELEALTKATLDAKKKIEIMANASGVYSWSISKMSENRYSNSRSIQYESSVSMSQKRSPQDDIRPGVIETKKSVQMEAIIS